MSSSYKPEELAAASTMAGDNKVGTIVSTGERMVIKIPVSENERVSIYLNRSKKSVSDIKKATEEDYVLNGNLYNMGIFQPVCHLRWSG